MYVCISVYMCAVPHRRTDTYVCAARCSNTRCGATEHACKTYVALCMRTCPPPHTHTHTRGHTHTHTYARAHVRACVISEYTVLQSMCTTMRIHNAVHVYNNTQYEHACPEICKCHRSIECPYASFRNETSEMEVT